jgi:hypothetical protein
MKKILMIVGLLASTTAIFAQKAKEKNTYSFGVQTLIPVGSESSTVLNGVTVQAEKAVSKNVKLTLSGSANGSLNFKDNSVIAFPVLGGLKLGLDDSKKLSLGLAAGATFYNLAGSSAKFTYSPTLNVDARKYSVSLIYLGTVLDGSKNQSSVGLGVAYKL